MMRQSRQLDGYSTTRAETSTVEIISKKIDSADGEHEKVVLYGFVENSQAQAAGFTLFCTVHWLEKDISFESEDKRAERYFEELLKIHIDSHLLILDAVFELTLNDPDIGGPVGHGSGFVRFHGGFQN